MPFAELALYQAGTLFGSLFPFKGAVIMNNQATQGVYRLARGKFAPPVSLKENLLLRRDLPYKPMKWDLTINIHGGSAAEAYTALANIVDLANKVTDFNDNETTEYPVILAYKPNGSIVSYSYYARVLEVTGITLPDTFEETGSNFVLLGLRIGFITQGAFTRFLGNSPGTEAQSASPASGPSLTKQVATFPTSHSADSLYAIQYQGVAGTAAAATDSVPATIFSTNDTNKLHILAATGTGVGAVAQWASVADVAANYAPYNMARLTPAAAATLYQGYTLGSNTIGRTFNVWALYRVNGAGRVFTLELQRSNGGSRYTALSAQLTANQPTLQYLGAVRAPDSLNTSQITYRASVDSITGAPTLDLLSLIFMVDDQYANVITINPQVNVEHTVGPITVDPNVLMSPTPNIVMGLNGTGPSYEGSPYPYTYGNTVAALLVIPRGVAWRFYRGAPDNTVHNYQLTVTRYMSIISPQ